MNGPPLGRNRSEESQRERAVSDVVAFVLTFSIIIAGVGIVSTGGFDQLTQFTNSQQVENSDRGMQAAAASVDNLQQSSDTYREFDLSLGGGNIWFQSGTSIQIDGIDTDGIGDGNGEIPLNSLNHRFELSDDVLNLSFEGGGVFRSNTATPQYDPAIRCIQTDDGEDRAIISLVQLTTDESIDRSGAFASEITISPTGVPRQAPVTADKQFISFRAELSEQQQVYDADSDSITLDISNTAQPEQWERFFEDEGWETANGQEYSCDVDAALVRVTTVELSLLQRDPVSSD